MTTMFEQVTALKQQMISPLHLRKRVIHRHVERQKPRIKNSKSINIELDLHVCFVVS